MAATLLFAALLAQSAAGETADPRQLDRIRTAVGQQPPITIPAEPDDTGTLLFRVKVQAWAFTYKAWEDPGFKIPSYVRPSMPLAHYEFQKMVTPEAFRASILYPGMIGVTIDIDARLRALRAWRHERDERRAREEVRREIEAFLKARAEGR